MKYIAVIIMLLVSACAMTPEDAQTKSSSELCLKARMSARDGDVAFKELQNRDGGVRYCDEYGPSLVQAEQEKKQSGQMMMMYGLGMMYQASAPQQPSTITCSSYQQGYYTHSMCQ